MAYIVRDLPSLVATSSGKTAGVGRLDDANSITIYLTSSAAGAVTGSIIQVSQFDPADPTVVPGQTLSSFWVTAATVTSSNTAIVLTNVSFRGMRISSSSTGFNVGEVVAFASKQISV